jgi:hypothetical protein
MRMSVTATTAIRAALDDGWSVAELESARVVLADGGTDEDAARWLFAWAYAAIRPIDPEARPA